MAFFYLEWPYSKFAVTFSPLLAFIGFFTMRKATSQFYYSIFFFIVELLYPVIGTGLVLGFFVLLLLFKALAPKRDSSLKISLLEEEAYGQFSSDKDILMKYAVEEQIDDLLFDSMKIEPYLDILSSSNVPLKISSIGKLANLQTRESVHLLKLAQNDHSYEVRYFAKKSLEKVEKQFTEEIEALTLQIQKSPQSSELFRQRGLAYSSMQFFGLIERDLKQTFLDNALKDLRQSLEIDPDQEFLYLRITHIYMNLGKYDEVIRYCDEISNRSDLSRETKDKLIFFKSEAYFNQGNFSQVVETTYHLEETDLPFELIKNVTDWWTSFDRSN